LAKTTIISVLALTCLGGCSVPWTAAGFSHAPVDPSSPVAQDVIRASQHPGAFPRFADIPKAPTDLRPASDWQVDIKDMQARQAQLETQVAALPPVSPESTEPYAAQTRAKLGAAAGQSSPPDQRQRTEAEARALRERATPPPPPR
jgi:hypothetical protein